MLPDQEAPAFSIQILGLDFVRTTCAAHDRNFRCNCTGMIYPQSIGVCSDSRCRLIEDSFESIMRACMDSNGSCTKLTCLIWNGAGHILRLIEVRHAKSAEQLDVDGLCDGDHQV